MGRAEATGLAEARNVRGDRVDTSEKVATIYISGCSIIGTGRSGYGVVVRCEGQDDRHEFGQSLEATQNRMLLAALIRGLGMVREPSRVLVVTNATYVTDSVPDRVAVWQRFGWRRSVNGKPTPNADLWEQVWLAMQRHDVRASTVRSRDDWHFLDVATRLATKQARLAGAKK